MKLRYGIVVRDGALNSRIHPIEVMHKRFLKLKFSRNNRLCSEPKVLDKTVVFLYTSIKYHANKLFLKNRSFVTHLRLKTTKRSYDSFAPKLELKMHVFEMALEIF